MSVLEERALRLWKQGDLKSRSEMDIAAMARRIQQGFPSKEYTDEEVATILADAAWGVTDE